MVFALLHRPPELDSLNLSLSEIDEMEEHLAIRLYEKLQDAREVTVNAKRGRGRSK